MEAVGRVSLSKGYAPKLSREMGICLEGIILSKGRFL